eukprot:CAMPEP_0172524368 /NCGR_PEP_ID=MMETSP1066-20121228/294150_1 /TAXON_ID=671091 /ORGANISM="Coscinodiscus wailesii, Strain CCMP2513" /LENGTH=312 /DNA_ID=CAMNT_0013307489 /DNA_START=240 /DNA_END=1175 /DNA_ORIENTATION=+
MADFERHLHVSSQLLPDARVTSTAKSTELVHANNITGKSDETRLFTNAEVTVQDDAIFDTGHSLNDVNYAFEKENIKTTKETQALDATTDDEHPETKGSIITHLEYAAFQETKGSIITHLEYAALPIPPRVSMDAKGNDCDFNIGEEHAKLKVPTPECKPQTNANVVTSEVITTYPLKQHPRRQSRRRVTLGTPTWAVEAPLSPPDLNKSGCNSKVEFVEGSESKGKSPLPFDDNSSSSLHKEGPVSDLTMATRTSKSNATTTSRQKGRRQLKPLARLRLKFKRKRLKTRRQRQRRRQSKMSSAVIAKSCIG